MSKSVADYIKELEKELNQLQEKIQQTEEEIVQEQVQFELNRNKRSKRVGKKLEDYKPQGMGLSFDISAEKFRVSSEEVKDALKNMYKIDQ